MLSLAASTAMGLVMKAYQQSESTPWAVAADGCYAAGLEEAGDVCMFVYHARRWSILNYLVVADGYRPDKVSGNAVSTVTVILNFKNKAFPLGKSVWLDVGLGTVTWLRACWEKVTKS